MIPFKAADARLADQRFDIDRLDRAIARPQSEQHRERDRAVDAEPRLALVELPIAGGIGGRDRVADIPIQQRVVRCA